MYLLDFNVLIALVDANHVHHETVADWFWQHHVDGWATCSIAIQNCPSRNTSQIIIY